MIKLYTIIVYKSREKQNIPNSRPVNFTREFVNLACEFYL
nr:MAG TPA: hypothetical protein [Caudoviricetes sp.]